MINPRVFKLAVHAIQSRSIRSWITILGIIVSIAVIFILLTLTSGLTGAIVELFEDFGTNRIFIASSEAQMGDPSSLMRSRLTDSLIDRIEREPYVDVAIAGKMDMTMVRYRNTDRFIALYGLPNTNVDKVARAYAFDRDLDSGTFWRTNEHNVIILGYNVANNPDDYFGREIFLRNSMTIGNQSFRVIGVYKRLGTPDDDLIYLPLEDLRQLTGEQERIDFIDVIVNPGYDMRVAEDRLTRLLDRLVGEENVMIMTPEGILRQFEQILGIVQGLLLAIASISLLVGAIGIANTMFTSVLEREKEIGVLKAVGAKNSDILQLFMFESGLIGLIGGIIGVLIGIGASYLIGFIVSSIGFEYLLITISPLYVAFCLLFAFIVGALSGFLPSYVASRKKIVDTLREQ
ncbi:MAG: ABC transporter permease [Candidatus Woesearchaeota archaeon]